MGSKLRQKLLSKIVHNFQNPGFFRQKAGILHKLEPLFPRFQPSALSMAASILPQAPLPAPWHFTKMPTVTLWPSST